MSARGFVTGLKGVGAVALSFAGFYAAQLLLVAGVVWLIRHEAAGWVIVLAFAAGAALILKVFSR